MPLCLGLIFVRASLCTELKAGKKWCGVGWALHQGQEAGEICLITGAKKKKAFGRLLSYNLLGWQRVLVSRGHPIR